MASKVSNLSSYQQALSRAGANEWDQIKQVANQYFGNLRDQAPPGSTIIDDDGGSMLTYRDASGNEVRLTRNLDGRSPDAGAVKTISNKPLVATQSGAGEQDFAAQLVQQLSALSGQQSANALAQARGETPAALDTGIGQYLDQISGIASQLQQPASLASLDPETQAALKAISDAEQARLRQQFEQDQGAQLARLFGNRVQQSSIATGALSRLLQDQGLVSAQQLSNAANRELVTRQFLTEQGLSNLQTALSGLGNAANTQLGGFQASNAASQAQTNTLAGLLSTLTGQATQRDLAGANIEQQLRELAEQSRQFNVNAEFANTASDIAVKKANASDLLKKALGIGAAVALAPATGGGSLGSIPGTISG